jgi:hypothetical protein
MSRFFHVRAAATAAVALVLSLPLAGQGVGTPDMKMGSIIGTVTDANGYPVPNSTVVLRSADSRRTVVTPENGFFEFHDVEPGVPSEISISANNFADWTSPGITLEPEQFKIVTGIRLRIVTEVTKVQVTYDPVEVATEQLKIEEKQRVLGFIPNFYVSYDADPAPLTSKMKFTLALKLVTDPVTVFGIALVSASEQAGNRPNYGQGWGAYGKRVGANSADGFIDIMMGGAILPSVLHQDPRYFYQGAGTTSSRLRHAMFSPFVAKGDNGKWQPNYSSLGGDLATSAIGNLYYPRSDRGAGLVFTNFAIGTTERIASDLAQEFILSRFTRRGDHMR